MTLIMQAYFRALAAMFSTAAPAQTIAGLSILMLTLYTGYSIPQPSMIGALRWITYINVSILVIRSIHTFTHLDFAAAQIRFRSLDGERVP